VDKNNPKYLDLVEDAKKYYASGYDEVYITNQFAEQGVADTDIENVLIEIRKIEKHNRKQRGIKLLFLGLSIAGAGVIITFITYLSGNWQGPVGYVMIGGIVAGIATAVSGLSKIF
jgi:hypothetical protein